MTAPTRRTYAVLALGAAAFIVYGSLVPFAFVSLPWEEANERFLRAMADRANIRSRSDALVNVLIAVPLGFTLLGACRADRIDVGPDLLVGLAWLPVCVLLAAMVEFGQVFLPGRFCAGSDVWCQGLCALLGMAAWITMGRWATTQARLVWGRTHGSGAAGRLLLAYAGLVVVVQALPLDLNPSPRGVYRKIRDEVRFVPFGEFHDADADRAKLVKLFGLFLPAGLLASRLPCGGGRMLLAAAGLACGTEAMQVVLHSRTPSATDAVVGITGTAAGWAIGRRTIGLEEALLLGQAWAAALVVAYWQPFTLDDEPSVFGWLPGLPLESGNPLFTLEELLTKPVLFAPFGVLAAVLGGRMVWAVGIAGTIAGVIEVGQVYLGSHTPGLTDVLLGALGGYLGHRIRMTLAASQE